MGGKCSRGMEAPRGPLKGSLVKGQVRLTEEEGDGAK